MLKYRDRRRLLEEEAWRAKAESGTINSHTGWRTIRELGLPVLVASVVTLIFSSVVSPVSQVFSYYLSDYLSQPIMSIEYVEIIRDLPVFTPPTKEVDELIRSPAYMAYVSSHPEFASVFGVGLGQNASTSDIARLSETTRMMIGDLGLWRERIRLARAKLQGDTDLDGLKKVITTYFAGMFNPYATSGGPVSNIRQAFLLQLSAEDEKVSSILHPAENLAAALGRLTLPSTGLKLKVSVVNRGNTDGLILSHAVLAIRDTPDSAIPLSRIPPPKSPDVGSELAVRTFVVNSSEAIREGSVGKVEKHTMTEFWFQCADESKPEYRSDLDAFLAAPKPVGFTVTLFDQEGHRFRYVRPTGSQKQAALEKYVRG
jgi:hypothetical protein